MGVSPQVLPWLYPGLSRPFPAAAQSALDSFDEGDDVSAMKSQIAAILTAGVLGGLAGFALGHEHQLPAAEKPVAAKPAMHTKVVHRTIHVTKHAKSKHPPAGAGGHHGAKVGAGGGQTQTATATPTAVATGSSSTGAATEGGTYTSEPVTTSTSGAVATVESGSEGAAPVTTSTSGASASGGGGSETAAVTTATSGGGGGGGGGESEGGDGGGGGGGGDD
jgi:hypothetical protein